MPFGFSSTQSRQQTRQNQIAQNAGGQAVSGDVSRGGALSLGGNSFVINTGNNKFKQKTQGGSGGQKGIGKGGSAGGSATDFGGNVAISVVSTDAGAFDLAKLAVQTNADLALRLGSQALQVGEDVAAVAVPTLAALNIIRRPVDSLFAQADIESAENSAPAPVQSNKALIAIGLIGLGITIWGATR